jgi:hypothetical protein
MIVQHHSGGTVFMTVGYDELTFIKELPYNKIPTCECSEFECVVVKCELCHSSCG